MTDKDNSQTGEYSYTYSYSYSKEGGEKKRRGPYRRLLCRYGR